MDQTKREQLDVALRRIERRWGPQTVVPASAAPVQSVGIPTGFESLDQILGLGGVPLQAITLLSGATTCGKLTVAYKILRLAQGSATGRRHPVAILELSASTDADYLSRCGVDLDCLLMIRPLSSKEAPQVLLDLVRSRQLRAIVLDSLADLRTDAATARHFDQLLPQLNLALKGTGCALIILDEVQPPWLSAQPEWSCRAIRHYAALSIELHREGWIEAGGELVGYRAQARILKRRGPGHGQTAPISIEFGETVHARATW